MTEARRLNMVGGHFIWLWIDTSTSTGYFHQATVPIKQPLKTQQQQQNLRSKADASSISDATSKNRLDLKTENTSKKFMQTTPTYGDVYNLNNQKKVQSTNIRLNSNRSGEETYTETSEYYPSSSASSKVNVDFSQGFDPFRVLLEQRQDENLKIGTPQHYQERNAHRESNKHVPTNNRLILGLRSESTVTTEIEEPIKEKKRIQRRNSSTSNRNRSRNINAQRHSEIDYDIFYDEQVGESNNGYINFSGENMEIPVFLLNQTISSKNLIFTNNYRNLSDDNLDIFIDNNNFNEDSNMKLSFKRKSISSGSSSSASSSFVSFHQFKDFPVGLLALRPIRMNVDRHFIRAAVRLFAATWEKINSSKSTVNPVPSQQRPITASSSMFSQSRRTQQNRYSQGTTPLYNAKKFDNEMNIRIMRRKRNIHTVNQLLMVTLEKRLLKLTTAHNKFEIKHIQNQNHFSGEYHNYDDGNEDADPDRYELQKVPAKVNSSFLLKEFNRSSHKNENSVSINQKRKRRLAEQKTIEKQLLKFNSSFTSDLQNNNDNIKKKTNLTYYISNTDNDNLTNVKVSFNRNFSGLWKQNDKNKSNIHSLNDMRHQQTIISGESINEHPQFNASNIANQPMAPIANQISRIEHHSTTESMAKQASQTIFENFFNQRSSEGEQHLIPNKRQNTWWSMKKDIPTLAQYKRMQYETNNKNTNQLTNTYRITDQNYSNPMKCETPNYVGGCYGTTTRQDIKNAAYFSR